MVIRIAMAAMLLIATTACSEFDMQGVDPKDFYAEHPVKNSVETRHLVHIMDFKVDTARLTGDEIESLHAILRDLSPEAVDVVQVKLAPSQITNEARREHIVKLLRGMGYPRKLIRFDATKGIPAREAVLDISYAVAVAPHCPDWRTSPVTTYSNTKQGNFGCASAVNLGLMVADPRDLEHGSGYSGADAERPSAVIRQYRTGQDFAPITNESASEGASGTATGAQ